MAGTWGIFSSYGGDDPLKLVYVQQYQDSCLVTRDYSGISTRLGRVIRMLLEMRADSLASTEEVRPLKRRLPSAIGM